MDDPSPLTALRDILGLEGAEERLKDLLKETKDDVGKAVNLYYDRSSSAAAAGPLAERMRPQTLSDLVGQEEALGDVLRQAVQEDRLPSLILWGPPGCGKTSFAHCVAGSTRCNF